ncbi:MAG: PIG-L family deacetylase [Opitutaceae bacterium]|nr:PIG-L family deacetylase [Opitutaceae bacterium]
MKPTTDAGPLLAFGAHPDDIEFGCGGVIAAEAKAGRPVHLVVCSRGEAGTNGTPPIRTREAKRAADLLGATIEFIDLGGDAHFEERAVHVIELAGIIRQVRPATVLTTSTVENQHPDHVKLGRMVRDAARLARFGGLKELRRLSPHAIGQMFFYAVSPEAEPTDLGRVLVDVSAPETVACWTAAMRAHASQMKTRDYAELQLTRARLNGLRAGVTHAIPLFPADALLVDSLASLGRAARRF